MAPSSNEKSLFLDDFNAHHKAWCSATQNRAGINLSDHFDAMNRYVMMNMEHEEYVPTITYNTIDLSIIHKDIAAKVKWLIYDGLSSDHALSDNNNMAPGLSTKKKRTTAKVSNE